MPEINRPGIGKPLTGSRLSTSQPVGGAVAIGQIEQQVGSAQAKTAEQFFQVANKSFKESLYNNAISQATEEMNQAYQDRLSKPVDDDGNPTYQHLPQDIDEIGKNIRESISSKIIDSDASAKFNQDFKRFVSNKHNQSLGEARRQHLSYSRASLSQGVRSIQNQALGDDTVNIPGYLAKASDMIDTAVQGGVISPVQADQLKESTRSNVMVTSYSNLINNDLATALDLLGHPAEELGLSNEEHNRLNTVAAAAVRDKERQIKREEKELAYKTKEQQNLNAGNLELDIIDGIAGEKEVEEAAALGSISKKNRISLLKKIKTSNNSVNNKAKINLEINKAIESDGPLRGFTSRQITDNFNAEVLAASPADDQGNPQPLSLTKQANLAAKRSVPVKGYVGALEHGLTSEDPNQNADALQAVLYLKDNNPESLQGMDKESRGIAAAASILVRNTSTSLKDAMIRAQKLVVGQTDPVKQERARSYSRVKEFRPQNIQDTVLSMLDVDELGFDDEVLLAEGSLETFNIIYKEGFIATGTVDGAKSYAQDEIRPFYGNSHINGTTGKWFGDTVEFMYLPPEKVYKGVPADVLKRNFQKEAATMIPEGIDVEDVRVASDAITRKDPNNPTYRMYYVDSVGNEVNLPNRWFFSAEAVNKETLEGLQPGLDEASSRFKERQRNPDPLADSLNLEGK